MVAISDVDLLTLFSIRAIAVSMPLFLIFNLYSFDLKQTSIFGLQNETVPVADLEHD